MTLLSKEGIALLLSKGFIWPKHSVKHKHMKTGEIFNRLTALAIVRNKPHTMSKVLCRCICGKLTVVCSGSLQNGGTKSCGCAYDNCGGTATHGLSHLTIWKSWHSMVYRCSNPEHPSYARYTLLGYPPEWQLFENFYNDMKTTWFAHAMLDRIDNDKGYSKANCQWLNKSEHAIKTQKDRKA